MSYRQLWVLVEGNDDERLIQCVKPELERLYNTVRIYKYANVANKRIKEFLRVMRQTPSWDYVYLEDINSAACVTSKKDKIVEKYRDRMERDRIVVVVMEIESWYLAGLDEGDRNELVAESFGRTDDITKERFNNMMPRRRFGSRIDYMGELLKRFRISTAATNNRSFEYFMRKATGSKL